MGRGPVGLFAIKSAIVMGAARVIAIESVPERIALAKAAGATDVIDFTNEDVLERIREITKGEGAGRGDRLRRHGSARRAWPDGRTQRGAGNTDQHAAPLRAGTDGHGGTPVRQHFRAGRLCRAVPVNMAAIVQKGITIKTGQTHVKRYLEKLTG